MQSYPWRGGGSSARGWRRGGATSRMTQPPQEAPPALGQLIRTLTVSRLIIDESGAEDATISDVKYVSSYNIMERRPNEILVPGLPPAWTPPRKISFSRRDSGSYFRDDNAARFPQYPMEPTIRSVLAQNRLAGKDPIDVCACASTLGSLMRWTLGSDNPFSVVVNLVGDTAFFLRREESPTTLIKDIKGYGHSFLEACTGWSIETKGSVSHQRVIQYRLGNKLLLVRFECDGYVPSEATISSANGDIVGNSQRSLEDCLAQMPTAITPTLDELQGQVEVKSIGREVPQSSLLDVKTRASFKKDQDTLAEEMPRLWLRQVTKFVLAFQDRGKFEPVEVQDIGEEMRQWEKQSEKSIRRFAGLVAQIADTAKAIAGGKLEVRSDGNGSLEVRDLSELPADEWAALPDDLQAEWEG